MGPRLRLPCWNHKGVFAVNRKRKHGFLSIYDGLSVFYRPGSEILTLLADNFQKSFLILLSVYSWILLPEFCTPLRYREDRSQIATIDLDRYLLL